MGISRVFVVDDSPLILKVVTDALREDASLEIVGTAGDGVEAMRELPKARPDIILLDVDMPRMNGLETLAAIRNELGRVPVIMFSNMTRRGADETLDALQLGANDYVTKPTNRGGIEQTKVAIRELLGAKIRAFAQPRAKASSIPAPPTARPPRPPRSPRTGRIDLVGIGISTGGPPALQTLVEALPAELPVPIVIVQHMPPIYTATLASRLNEVSPLEVSEVTQTVPLQPGHIYIAPGDQHLVTASRRRLELRNTERVRSCRPAVDVLFQAMATTHGANALGIVMTGMGQDGLDGCRALAQAGATVWAQDEASSAVWGMPGAVVTAGLVTDPMPLADLAGNIVHACQR